MKKVMAIVLVFIGLAFISQNYFHPLLTLVMFLMYGILRWKLAENEILYVKNKSSAIGIKLLLVIYGLTIFSGAGNFGGVMPEETAWIGSVVALIGLLLAFEILRYWSKVKVKINEDEKG
jgi:hypothetical protein